MTRTLATTDCPLTAQACGYDAPADPREDGFGFILTQDGDGFTLTGPDGEVTFDAAEAGYIARALNDALRFKARRAAA